MNNQYYRETLLNYATNRCGYNKSSSVGKIAELIRQCRPETIKEWEDFYFSNAIQNKKNGEKITRSYIEDLGKKLYIKISEVVENELQQIKWYTLFSCFPNFNDFKLILCKFL